MSTKQNRFDLEWWVVSKRSIYLLVALGVVAALAGAVALYVRAYGNPFGGAKTNSDEVAGARFISLEGEVRVVRAATRETVAARSDTPLNPGDVVQTQADGRARILFVDGSTYFVRPNSVIQIRDNTTTDDGRRTNVRVHVDRGQINVRTEAQSEGTSNVVETRLTESKLTAETGASIGVNDNNTEEIRVTGGAIETATRGGERTTLRAGEYIAVNQQGGIGNRERLLGAPVAVAPRNLEKIAVGANGAGAARLRWQRPVSGAPAHYRVEVATSPFFVQAGKVVERDQLGATEFQIGDLRPSVYFWHVRAIASSGQLSEWSEPQKFIVAAGGTGEQVPIAELAAEYVAGSIYLVRGRAGAGNSVRIGDREVIATSDGSFQLQINAPPNSNEITVEAEDAQGNKSQYRLPLRKA
ncbi:MAG: FecR domain-containing protein [Pyrinomonadaceae bacterium]|nr:FecR domain-containing protein [Pyrinomonadaceae bacterium]